MDKKARIGLMSLVILLIGFIFVIIILPLISAPDDETVLWSRTENSETYKNPDGTMTANLYSQSAFIDDESKRYPNYVPFNQVVNMSFNESDGSITYSYRTQKREFSVTVKMGFILDIPESICTGPGWHWFDIGKGYCGVWADDAFQFLKDKNISYNVLITDNTYSYKYALNLSAIPFNYRNKISYIALRLENVTGLTWDDVELDTENKRLVIKDKVALNYDDLLESGFTLNLYDKQTVLIGNVSDKENLWLDPTITIKASYSNGGKNTVIRKGSCSSVICQNAIYDNMTYMPGYLYVGHFGGSIVSQNNSRILMYLNLSGYFDFDVVSIDSATLHLFIDCVQVDRINDDDVAINLTIYNLTSTRNWRARTSGMSGSFANNSIGGYNASTWNEIRFGSPWITSGGDFDKAIGSVIVPGNWAPGTCTSFLANLSINPTIVNNWITNEATENGFLIKSNESTANDEQLRVVGVEGSSNSVPYWTITYTPYINTISPTSGQFFKEDAPTARFNITTGVAMDACRWSPDTGTTNYTLTRLNSTYFWLQNITMVDETYSDTIFYCNQSSDNTWRTSDTVSFDVDSMNITRCRDLNVQRTYVLIKNISSSGTCLIINNNSVNLNGQNYLINYSISSDGYGIYSAFNSSSMYNLLIQQTNLSQTASPAIFISGSGNNLSSNIIKTYGSYSNGINITGFSNNISNNDINVSGVSAYGISINTENGKNNLLTLNKFASIFYSLGIESGDNNIIRDSNLSVGGVILLGYVSGTIFTNTTYSTETLGGFPFMGGNLNRKWYFDANVTDTTTGGPVAGANITVKDVNGDVVLSLLTDSNGDINRQEVIEYYRQWFMIFIATIDETFIRAHHTVTVSKLGYQTNSSIVNMTALSEKNIFYETNIKRNMVGVNIVSPANQTYNNRTIYFNITVDKPISLCKYTINNWINNYTMTGMNASYYNATNSSMADGSFTARFWCNDTDNNINSTSLRYFSLDATPPSIFYDPSTDSASYVTRDWIFINVTASDANKETVNLAWSTSGIMYNSTFANNKSNYYWENKTALVDDIYTFYAWINDSFGNFNATALRTIIVDTRVPAISIKSPLNQTYNINISNLNYTYSDSNPSSCWYSRNRGLTNSTAVTAGINFSNTVSIEGSNNYTLYCNDSINSLNSTIVYFFKDTVNPLINLVYPGNVTYNYTITAVNFTVSDANLATCWYSTDDGIINTSITCGTNKTGLTSVEGTNKWLVGVNDTAGNANTSKINFFIDTIQPAVSIKYPANTTYNINISNLNYTYSDTNPGSCWYSRNRGLTNTSSVSAGVNFSNVPSIEGSNNYTLYCNDTSNNLNSTFLYFFKDTVFPLISYGTGTENDGTNFTRTNINVNVTVTEANEKNITFSLFKSGIINETGFITNIRSINWTILADGIYYYNVTVIDTSGNTNTSSARRIGLDNAAPTVIIDHPKAQSYIITNFSLNYTVSDAVSGVSSCWYKVENLTDLLISNTTIVGCVNSSFNVTGEGTFNLTFYSNDTLNQLKTTKVVFLISTTAPSTTLNYPTDGLWLNTGNNVYFNFTTTDIQGVNTCQLWGDWTGTWHKNYTWINVTMNVQNFTIVNPINEGGPYTWSVWCNDSDGNGAFALNNFTFGVDTAFPQIKTVYPTNTTYSIAISTFDYIYSDTHADSCWYSRDRGGTNSSSVSAGINFTSVISVENNNTYTLFCNDSANNLNTTSITFNKDTVLPALIIVHPANQTYNVNISNLNFTVGDVNLQTCIWSRDGWATNTTITCGNNVSNMISIEGSNTYLVWANDTSGNANSSSVTFWKDTVIPLVKIIYPANTSYTTTVTALNYTYSDSNPSSCWYSINLGLTNSTAKTAGINFTGLVSAEGSNNWTVYCNDTSNNINTTAIVYFSIESIPPSVYPVYPLNNVNYNVNVSNLNYTYLDINPSSCWYSRNRGLTNSTAVTAGINFSNTISIEGSNNYTLYCNDSVSNLNTTIITFFKDTIFPQINITYPYNISYDTEVRYLNYTYSDTNPDSCWYSTNAGATNSTRVDAGFNFSYVPSVQNSNVWNLYCNDSFGNLNSTVRVFFLKDTIPPILNIVYPANTSYITNVSNLNYTISDDNLESCWYSKDKGTTNTSIICGNNVSDITSIEGNNTWIMWANDTASNKVSKSVTFFKDTIAPDIVIIEPVNDTYYSIYYINISLNISVNYSDVDSYVWSFDSGWHNYSFTPNTTMSWAQGLETTIRYTMQVWANDSLNNIAMNTTEIVIYIPRSGEVTGGPGGGGTSVTSEKTIQLGAACGNKKCEEGENFFVCPEDCAQDIDTLIKSCLSTDPVKRANCSPTIFWAFLITLIIIIITIASTLYKRYEKEKQTRRWQERVR